MSQPWLSALGAVLGEVSTAGGESNAHGCSKKEKEDVGCGTWLREIRLVLLDQEQGGKGCSALSLFASFCNAFTLNKNEGRE